MPQDLPPTGGYDPVQYRVRLPMTLTRDSGEQHPDFNWRELQLTFDLQRNIPTRGYKPGFYLLGMVGIMTYGWVKLFYGQRERKCVHCHTVL